MKAASPQWTGFYLGADLGYGWGDRGVNWSGDATAETRYLSTAIPRSTAVDPTGLLGGAHVGYDYQIGRYVVGIETDLSFSKINGNGGPQTGGTVRTVDGGNLPLYNIYSYSQYQTSAEQTLRSLGTLRGRFGILATDQLLLYATGGLAYGRASVSGTIVNTGVYSEFISASDGALFFTQQYPACSNGCASNSASRWLTGGTVGAGVEYAFLDRWSARFEYLYYNLGKLSVTVADPRFASPTFNASALFAGQIVRMGVSYRFE